MLHSRFLQHMAYRQAQRGEFDSMRQVETRMEHLQKRHGVQAVRFNHSSRAYYYPEPVHCLIEGIASLDSRAIRACSNVVEAMEGQEKRHGKIL